MTGVKRMENKSLDDFTANDVSLLLYDAVEAVIVAEGVEQQTQIDMLNKLGVLVIQGYFYDRPLPKEEMTGRLRSPHYGK